MAIGLPTLGRNKKSDAAVAATPVAVGVPTSRARPSSSPKPARNRGWMIAGAVLVVFSAIGAASIASSLSQSVDVLVASRPIPEGAVISTNDFRSVSIAADAGAIQAISPDDGEKLIGQLAAGPIGSGSILHPDQFTNRADQQVESTVVIGAEFGENDIPLLDLLPGDRVRLFEVFPRGVTDLGGLAGSNDAGPAATVAREITDAEVVAATGINSQFHVAMRINESSANIIANLIEQRRLTIALVDSLPATTSIDPAAPVEPLEPAEPGDN